MSSDFTTVLDECLDRLKAGESISACLGRYPEHAEELEPLLEAAQFVEALRFTEPPRPQALARGRQRFLTEAARLREQQQATPRPFLANLRAFFMGDGAGLAWSRIAAVIAVALLLFGTLSGVAVQASESSLPGDPLYPVKQAARQVQLLTTLDSEVRKEKQEQIQAAEREEVRRAIEQGRVFEKDVAGVILDWQGNMLVLEDGLNIWLTDTTQIEGQPKAGYIAEVHIRSEDGRLLAQRIKVQEAAVIAMIKTPTATPSPTPEPTETPQPTNTPKPPKPLPTATPTETPKPKVTDTPTSVVTVAPPTEGPHIFEVRGPIDSLGESMWVVAGTQIRVTSSTVIKGEPAVGRIAHVQANRLGDGTLVAVEIDIEMPAVTPTPRKVYFSGVVESKESQTVWYIAGQRTRLDDRTHVSGELKVGAFVDVEGVQESPTTVFAQKIIVKRACANLVPLEGVIQSIDAGAGVWIVGGFTIRVGGGVPIQGTPMVGATAQVEACQMADGTFSAERIFIVPTPTPTETPTATMTPTGTPTATLTATPVITATVIPTATLPVTSTVESGVTPTPSSEVGETPTPTPTVGVGPDTTPTPEPLPAATPTATLAPEVSATPTPSSEPEAGSDLTPVPEPSPSATSSPPGEATPTVAPTAEEHEVYTATPTTNIGPGSTPTSTPEPSP